MTGVPSLRVVRLVLTLGGLAGSLVARIERVDSIPVLWYDLSRGGAIEWTNLIS